MMDQRRRRQMEGELRIKASLARAKKMNWEAKTRQKQNGGEVAACETEYTFCCIV